MSLEQRNVVFPTANIFVDRRSKALNAPLSTCDNRLLRHSCLREGCLPYSIQGGRSLTLYRETSRVTIDYTAAETVTLISASERHICFCSDKRRVRPDCLHDSACIDLPRHRQGRRYRWGPRVRTPWSWSVVGSTYGPTPRFSIFTISSGI